MVDRVSRRKELKKVQEWHKKGSGGDEKVRRRGGRGQDNT